MFDANHEPGTTYSNHATADDGTYAEPGEGGAANTAVPGASHGLGTAYSNQGAADGTYAEPDEGGVGAAHKPADGTYAEPDEGGAGAGAAHKPAVPLADNDYLEPVAGHARGVARAGDPAYDMPDDVQETGPGGYLEPVAAPAGARAGKPAAPIYDEASGGAHTAGARAGQPAAPVYDEASGDSYLTLGGDTESGFAGTSTDFAPGAEAQYEVASGNGGATYELAGTVPGITL